MPARVDPYKLSLELGLPPAVCAVGLAYLTSRNPMARFARVEVRTSETTAHRDIRTFVAAVNSAPQFQIALPTRHEAMFLSGLSRTTTSSSINTALIIDGTLVMAKGIRGGNVGYWSRKRQPEINVLTVVDITARIRALHIVKGGTPDSPATREAPWLQDLHRLGVPTLADRGFAYDLAPGVLTM